MKVTDIIRLLRKHIILLIVVPVILGTAVAFLTKDIYSSKTTLYTGMTSGTNVQMDQSFNLFTSNAAFDNLITVIQSRETSQEVAIRLLAQHLLLSSHDPKFISQQSFLSLKRATPAYINKLIVRHIYPTYHLVPSHPILDSSQAADTFSFTDQNTAGVLNMCPPSIDPAAYAQTVKNLYAYMSHDDTNYIYRLLNVSDPHYSIKAISSVNVQRITSSDLIELKYNSDDPGICQQTLVLLTEVCMKNYKRIKENRSDAVVKYFEFKVKEAASRLTQAENKLLRFNEDNKIINYADQSRSAENIKENLEGALQSKRVKLAGDNATIKQIEEKLNAQQNLQQKSAQLIDKRNQLAEVNAKLATAESSGISGSQNEQGIAGLRSQAEGLRSEINEIVNDLYNSKATVGTVAPASLMDNYLANVKDYQETKEGVSLLERRLQDARKQYDSYAPEGVNLKRIERDISVAEQEYIELLHGLNLAKLKVQDVELSSNIKAVDPPFYPLAPNPAKRMLLVIVAGILGLLIVLSIILILEYFDSSLRNPQKATRILHLEPAGIYPKLTGKGTVPNLPFVTNRLLEMMIQQIELYPKGRFIGHDPRTILFFSTQNDEGKSVILGNLSRKLKKQGKKVLMINFSTESLLQTELSRMDTPDGQIQEPEPLLINGTQNKQSLKKVNGHTDSVSEQYGLMLGKKETSQDSEEHLIYQVDESYYSISSSADLLRRNEFASAIMPDYILIELPPLLYFPYPAGLVSSSDVAVMVCRANRNWTEADQGALDTFMKLTRHNPLYLLNGVEMQVVKSSIGNIPKKQNWIHRTMSRERR